VFQVQANQGSPSRANNQPGSVQEKGRELGSTASHAAQEVKNKAQQFGSAAA
jgi:hypothetical protein